MNKSEARESVAVVMHETLEQMRYTPYWVRAAFFVHFGNGSFEFEHHSEGGVTLTKPATTKQMFDIAATRLRKLPTTASALDAFMDRPSQPKLETLRTLVKLTGVFRNMDEDVI